MAQLASDWPGTSDDIITSQSDEDEEDDDRSSDEDHSPGSLVIDTGESESDIPDIVLLGSLTEPPFYWPSESIFFQHYSGRGGGGGGGIIVMCGSRSVMHPHPHSQEGTLIHLCSVYMFLLSLTHTHAHTHSHNFLHYNTHPVIESPTPNSTSARPPTPSYCSSPPPPPPVTAPPPPPVQQKPSQSELEGFRGVTFIAKKEVATEGGWFPLTWALMPLLWKLPPYLALSPSRHGTDRHSLSLCLPLARHLIGRNRTAGIRSPHSHQERLWEHIPQPQAKRPLGPALQIGGSESRLNRALRVHPQENGPTRDRELSLREDYWLCQDL